MTSILRTALAAFVLSAGASAAMAQTPAPAPTAKSAPTAAPAAPAKPAAPAPSKTAPAPAATAAAGTPVFPTAVADKYSKETAGKARMHTCLDQYHANKATNGNGGMKWIQKGGGYYSACLKQLKS